MRNAALSHDNIPQWRCIILERIIIIGNAGAGKSTFAKALAKKLALPLVHLDQLYWTGSWETIPRDKFDLLLQKELEKPRWIIDGNFNRTIPHRLQYCDTVFYLDMPTITCLWGITKRILANYGKVRQDMGGSCTERFDRQKLALYKNVITFNRSHRKMYRQLLSEAQNISVITFRNRKQIKKYLNSI